MGLGFKMNHTKGRVWLFLGFQDCLVVNLSDWLAVCVCS